MIKSFFRREPSMKQIGVLAIATVMSICMAVWSWTYQGPKPTYAFCVSKSHDDGHSWDSNTYVGGKLVSTKHYESHDPEYHLEMLLTSGETEYWTVPEDIWDKAKVGSIVKRW